MAKKQKTGPADAAASKPPPDPRVASASSNYIFAATMFVIAAAMPWYFELPLIFDVTSPDFNPLIFVPVIFAGVGAVMLTRTMLGVMRAEKFGAAALSPTSAQLGQLFRPVVRTTSDIKATGDFVFVLKCIRTTRSGDDFEGHSSDNVLWKHTETCPANTRSNHGIAAMFRIPSDVPATRGVVKGTNSGNVRWVLTVTAPVRGVNFRQDFTVSVR